MTLAAIGGHAWRRLDAGYCLCVLCDARINFVVAWDGGSSALVPVITRGLHLLLEPSDCFERWQEQRSYCVTNEQFVYADIKCPAAKYDAYASRCTTPYRFLRTRRECWPGPTHSPAAALLYAADAARRGEAMLPYALMLGQAASGSLDALYDEVARRYGSHHLRGFAKPLTWSDLELRAQSVRAAGRAR